MTDVDGLRPVDLAEECGHKQCVELLMKYEKTAPPVQLAANNVRQNTLIKHSALCLRIIIMGVKISYTVIHFVLWQLQKCTMRISLHIRA